MIGAPWGGIACWPAMMGSWKGRVAVQGFYRSGEDSVKSVTDTRRPPRLRRPEPTLRVWPPDPPCPGRSQPFRHPAQIHAPLINRSTANINVPTLSTRPGRVVRYVPVRHHDPSLRFCDGEGDRYRVPRVRYRGARFIFPGRGSPCLMMGPIDT